MCVISSFIIFVYVQFAFLVLTVKVQCDGRIAFAQLILGRHLVFTGILYGNIFNFKGGEVLYAVFLDRQLDSEKKR